MFEKKLKNLFLIYFVRRDNPLIEIDEGNLGLTLFPAFQKIPICVPAYKPSKIFASMSRISKDNVTHMQFHYTVIPR